MVEHSSVCFRYFFCTLIIKVQDTYTMSYQACNPFNPIFLSLTVALKCNL